MKTLEQFKAEEHIKSIDLLQGKGRMFTKVNDKDLVVAKECDLKKPLFVIPLSKPVEGTEDQFEVIPNVYILINSEIKVVGSV